MGVCCCSCDYSGTLHNIYCFAHIPCVLHYLGIDYRISYRSRNHGCCVHHFGDFNVYPQGRSLPICGGHVSGCWHHLYHHSTYPHLRRGLFPGPHQPVHRPRAGGVPRNPRGAGSRDGAPGHDGAVGGGICLLLPLAHLLHWHIPCHDHAGRIAGPFG